VGGGGGGILLVWVKILLERVKILLSWDQLVFEITARSEEYISFSSTVFKKYELLSIVRLERAVID
jgi:hypothetical protein